MRVRGLGGQVHHGPQFDGVSGQETAPGGEDGSVRGARSKSRAAAMTSSPKISPRLSVRSATSYVFFPWPPGGTLRAEGASPLSSGALSAILNTPGVLERKRVGSAQTVAPVPEGPAAVEADPSPERVLPTVLTTSTASARSASEPRTAGMI